MAGEFGDLIDRGPPATGWRGRIVVGLLIATAAVAIIYLVTPAWVGTGGGICSQPDTEKLESELADDRAWAAVARRFRASGAAFRGCDKQEGLVSAGQWYEVGLSRSAVPQQVTSTVVEYGWTSRSSRPGPAGGRGLCFERMAGSRLVTLSLSFSEDMDGTRGQFLLAARAWPADPEAAGCRST